MKEKIAVGISGGVDSMVCARMLIDEGYEVIGVTMYIFDEEVNGVLTPPAFLKDARTVCETLGISHEIVDLRLIFKEKVIDPFINAYLKGETPNPCAMCNPSVKYGAFLEAIVELGADYLATGHYANIKFDELTNKYRIFQGKDARKDQSFLLHSLSQWQLSKLMLPLGFMEEKAVVRSMALEINKEIAVKKDSTDICFIPNGKYFDYIKEKAPNRVNEGNFITKDGEILGRHQGIVNYTIGQKRGLLSTLNRPMYVIELRAETNEVVLGNDEETYSFGFVGEAFNFTIYDNVPIDQPLKVKVCQWGYLLDCKIINRDKYHYIVFDKPARAVAVGQVAVFYRENEVLGGCLIKGIINERFVHVI